MHRSFGKIMFDMFDWTYTFQRSTEFYFVNGEKEKRWGKIEYIFLQNLTDLGMLGT